MATNPNPNPNSNPNPSLLPEIGPDGLPRENSVISYTEKVIEEEQLQLRKYIQENYTKIRDVERELANLTMEMKLTSGPKKAALEHMRKKIEISTEKIRVAKTKEEEARKAWEVASKAVQDEETSKQKLCEDLNHLVQESSNIQFARLEELKRRIGALNPSRSPTSVPNDGNSMGAAESSATPNVPPAHSTLGPAGGSSGPPSNHGNGGTAPLTNGQSQRDVEGRGKKKIIMNQGRGRGIGAIPKGRGSGAPGWTGAGFDVDR